MYVRVRLLGAADSIVAVKSKLTKIDEFRRILQEKYDVPPKMQVLFYGGKMLENGYTFHDYNIKLNDVIQLMVTQRTNDEVKDDNEKMEIDTNSNAEEENDTKEYKDAVSVLYAIGDLVDMKDQEGAWYEGEIVRIVYDPKAYKNDSILENDLEKLSNDKDINKGYNLNSETAHSVEKRDEKESCMDTNLLYGVLIQGEESTSYCKQNEIRPRARSKIDIKDLELGQTVMLNHNTEVPRGTGYWYDFKISKIIKKRSNYELEGTLYLGAESIPQNDTIIVKHDIYKIEVVVPLKQRSRELQNVMKTQTEKRPLPPRCNTCNDDESQLCKDCGCFICSGKESPDKIILCDECNHGFHLDCLTPPLEVVPKDDWYCQSCKRDSNEVIAPGGSKQKKKFSKSKRDWGRGMACVGKTKSCAMPSNHFGPIPGIEVGMRWRFRIQLSESGVHRPPVSGIHGRDVEGAYSLVLSGGYEDDVDNGDEFTYTGSGGRDLSGNKRTAEQSRDQTFKRENKALARNCAVKKLSEEGGDAGENWRDGKPVRVVRSAKMLKHFPKYAPPEGIRYDGIYKVVKYYPEKGKSGFIVWKYLLRRDDPTPAPWEPGAKQFDMLHPDGYLEAEAEKKALKENTSKKDKKQGIQKSRKPVKKSSTKKSAPTESSSSDELCIDADQSKLHIADVSSTTEIGTETTEDNKSNSGNEEQKSPEASTSGSPNRKNTMSNFLNRSSSSEIRPESNTAKKHDKTTLKTQKSKVVKKPNPKNTLLRFLNQSSETETGSKAKAEKQALKENNIKKPVRRHSLRNSNQSVNLETEVEKESKIQNNKSVRRRPLSDGNSSEVQTKDDDEPVKVQKKNSVKIEKNSIEKSQNQNKKRARRRQFSDGNSSGVDTKSDDEPPAKIQKKNNAKIQKPDHKVDITDKKSTKTSTDTSFSSLTSQEMDAINADILNAKYWKECLEICKTKGKTAFVEQVTLMFLCIICQSVTVSPVTTPCLHNFCMGCLKQAYNCVGTTCPCCREGLSQFKPEVNEQLKTALCSVLPGYDTGKK